MGSDEHGSIEHGSVGREESFWDTFWDDDEPKPTRRVSTRRRVARGAALTVALTAGMVATANAATVLTVAGNGLLVQTPMTEELYGSVCTGENTCTTVPYANSAIGRAPLEQGLVNLAKAIDTTSGPKVVLAYSQGGMIATMWLTQHRDDASANQTMFILFGNPQRARNGLGPAFNGKDTATPTDTKYKVIDICREYDSECDWPDDPSNLLAVLNASSGFLTVHMDYSKVDVNSPSNLTQTVGNTTYVLVPTDHLPLLEPLRRFGFNALADRLDTQLKPIIDAGYDRSGYAPLGSGTVNGFPTTSSGSASKTSASPAPSAGVAKQQTLKQQASTPTGVAGLVSPGQRSVTVPAESATGNTSPKSADSPSGTDAPTVSNAVAGQSTSSTVATSSATPSTSDSPGSDPSAPTSSTPDAGTAGSSAPKASTSATS